MEGNYIYVEHPEIAERSTIHYNLLFHPTGSAQVQWGVSWSETLLEFQERTGKGEGCIEENPLFVAAENNDFHLQSTSCAIDNGTVSGVYQTFFDLYGIDIRKDIEARTRPQGLTWDIGAYEYPDETPCLYGDVNGNNEVTAPDAAMAARYAVGLIDLTPEQITKADVNGEYGVTATDAALIARYAVGLINRFPVEE